MTKKEYDERRKALYDKAQAHINAEQLDEANKVMNQIEQLDDRFDALKETQANLRAMNYDDSVRVPEFLMGGGSADASGFTVIERINLSDGYGYRSASAADPMFLSNSRTMLDVAKENPARGSDILLQDGALGDVVRGMVTGKWTDSALRNEVTTTATGTLIPAVLSARIIDLARNLSLFSAAKVPTIPMTSNNVTVSRIAEDPAFSFKQEAAEGVEVGISIDGVKLESKTAYGYAYVSLEAIESSMNLDTILHNCFAKAIAECIDQGMLYGETDDDGNQLDYAPEGIMNDSNILTLEATNSGYDDFVKAVAAIRQQNYEPTIWAVNAYTDQTLSLLKDSESRYLEAPATLNGLQKIVSNQLAYDSESGSDGLVFRPDSMLIGIQNNIRIKLIEDEKCLKNGLIGFQIYSMLDCKVVQPKGICRITGLS